MIYERPKCRWAIPSYSSTHGCSPHIAVLISLVTYLPTLCVHCYLVFGLKLPTDYSPSQRSAYWACVLYLNKTRTQHTVSRKFRIETIESIRCKKTCSLVTFIFRKPTGHYYCALCDVPLSHHFIFYLLCNALRNKRSKCYDRLLLLSALFRSLLYLILRRANLYGFCILCIILFEYTVSYRIYLLPLLGSYVEFQVTAWIFRLITALSSS